MRRAFPEREGLNDSFNKNSIAYQKRDNKFLAGVWVCVRFLHGVPVGARFIAPTGWGRLMRTCAPLHPVGAINLAPTTGHRFARLHISAKIVRAPEETAWREM